MVHDRTTNGTIREPPNPSILAPILQEWVTKACTLTDSYRDDPDRKIYSLPYHLSPEDLDYPLPGSSHDPESAWRIIVPSVKTFGGCSLRGRQGGWFFRPAGIQVDDETQYEMDLIAGPGYGKYLTLERLESESRQGKGKGLGLVELAGMKSFRRREHQGYFLTLTQSSPLTWLSAPPSIPPQEVTYTGYLSLRDATGSEHESNLEIVFKVGHVSRARMPKPIIEWFVVGTRGGIRAKPFSRRG
ncbi:uncharacterized protein JCM6883_004220 [Sporobolomyces salmoneus]|uniref:uncharacterized protein n=1 Tax=Sporobolomyces salmoneus TaxID=183962 RepID=UPI0031708C24